MKPNALSRTSLTTSGMLAIMLMLTLAIRADFYTGTIFWDPSHSGAGAAGGSGAWSASSNAWWNGSSNLTWVSGSTAGTMRDYSDIRFGADGQSPDSPYTITLDQASFTMNQPASGGQWGTVDGNNQAMLALRFHGDYNLVSSVVGGSTLGTNTSHMIFQIFVDAGKTLNIDGTPNKITLLSMSNVSGNNSTTPRPSIHFAGGGVINLKGTVDVRQSDASPNGRISVGDVSDSVMTTLNLYGPDVYVKGSRLWLDNGIVNVDGARIDLTGHATSATIRSVLHIGSLSSGAGVAPSVLNINSGTVSAVADPAAAALASGVWFLDAGTAGSGGTINLNGGLLLTTNIQVNSAATASQTAQFVFNGGTLSVHASTTAAAHLNTFISGFKNSDTNRVVIDLGGAFIDTQHITGRTAVISSVLSGVGDLTKLGANTLRLSAANTYTGATIISGGTLALGIANAIVNSGTVSVAANATLDATNFSQTLNNLTGAGNVRLGTGMLTVANDTDTQFSGSLVSAGGLVKEGPAQLTLSGNLNYSGDTAINGGTLVFAQSTNHSYAGRLTGAGTFVKDGAATLTLGGDNSGFTGASIIRSGTLAASVANILAASAATTIEAGAAFVAGGFDQTLNNLAGAGAINLGAGNLTVANTTDTLFSGTIEGAGALVKQGTAALTFSGMVGYAGNTTINSGTLIFHQAGDRVYAGAFGGAGDFVKAGAGTLTLTGNSTGFAGATTISGGRLMLEGASAVLGGHVTIARDAMLGGAGTIDSLTAQAGSHIQIGGDDALTAQTLTITGVLDLTETTLRFDLFAGAGDRLNAGSLINGGNNTIDIGAFATGTFNLGDNIQALSSATLTINGKVVGTGGRQNAELFDRSTYLELVASSVDSASMTWTGLGGAAWNLTGSSWSGYVDGLFVAGDRVTFDDSSTVRTVNVTDGAVASDMIVDTAGLYTFAGSGITTDASRIIGTPFTATGKLVKKGSGTLALHNGANDFKGGVDIEQGALALGAGASLGTGIVSAKGAEAVLRADGGVTLANAINLSEFGLTFDTGAHNAVLTGVISGANRLAKTGAGVLSLTAANTHGGVNLAEGTVAISHAGALGSVLAATGANTTVRVDADGLDVATSFDLGAHGTTLDTQARAVTLSGTLTGTGTFAKAGSGTLALTGDNTAFAGALAINVGVVGITDARALGGAALSGAGILAIDATGDFTFASTAAGGFSGLASMNTGNFIIDANAGGAVSTGTLQINRDASASVAAAASMGGLEINGGLVTIGMNAAGTAPEHMLSVSHLTLISGSVALNIDVSGGGEVINPAVTPPSIFDQSMLTTTRLIAADGVTGAGVELDLVDMAGNPFPTPVQANLKQDSEIIGKVDYNYIAIGGTDGLYLGTGITAIEVNDGKTLLLDNAVSNGSTLRADISGDGGIRVNATGTITLSGNNTFKGASSLNRGTLIATTANVFGDSSAVTLAEGTFFDTGGNDQLLRNLSGAGAIALGAATLTVETTTASTFTGDISGAAGSRFVKSGTALLTLGGDNSFAALDIRAGNVRATRATAVGTGPISLAAASTLTFDGASDIALLAGIAGGGRLAFLDSSGTLGGANTLSSVALSGNSHIVLASSGALGGSNAAVTVGPGATLDISTHVITARSLAIDGGVLRFAQPAKLTLQSLSFSNFAAIGLSGPLTTDNYELATSATQIEGMPVATDSEHGRLTFRKIDSGRKLVMTVINPAIDPSRDVAAGYDALVSAMSSVNNRITDNFLMPLHEPHPGMKRSNLWTTAVAGFADYENNNDQLGHSENLYGVVAGYDVITRQKYIAGFYLSLTESEIRTSNDAWVDSDHQYAGIYGAARWGRFSIGANLGGGRANTESRRNEVTGHATGRYGSTIMGGSVEAGFMLAEWDDGWFRPSATVYYMNASIDDYTEKGPGAVQVANFKQELVQSLVRLQAAQRFKMPWLGWQSAADFTLGWRQNLSGNTSTFDMALVADPYNWIPQRSGGYIAGGVIVGAGLRSAITRSMVLGLDYKHEVTTGMSRHTCSATVRWSW